MVKELGRFKSYDPSIMGWKSTKELTREELVEKIEKEIIYNIDNLSNDTLCNILEILSEDNGSDINIGYNYTVI
jgi:hypothetical protein